MDRVEARPEPSRQLATGPRSGHCRVCVWQDGRKGDQQDTDGLKAATKVKAEETAAVLRVRPNV